MPASISVVNTNNKKDALDMLVQGIQVANGLLSGYQNVQEIGGNASKNETAAAEAAKATRQNRQRYTLPELESLGLKATPIEIAPPAAAIEGANQGSPIVAGAPTSPVANVVAQSGENADSSPLAKLPKGKVPDAYVVQPDGTEVPVTLQSRKVAEDISQQSYREATLRAAEKEHERAQKNADRTYQLEKEKAAQAEKDRAEGKLKSTDAQAKEAYYGHRLLQANAVFDELTKGGYNRADAATAANAQIPGMVGAVFPKIGKSSENQRQAQAEANFITGVLRPESGATIKDSEFAKEVEKYFPRPGDDDKTIALKKAAREQAIEGIKAAAGPAWGKVKDVGIPFEVAQQKGLLEISSGKKEEKTLTRAEKEALLRKLEGH